jgi:pyruvate dehydrogenase E2 component (dihydrolipoamide acetyltransferase)
MATDVTMPRLSDSMEEGTILKWLVSEGDEVTKGQEIVEIETDKANMTYEADAAGVIAFVAGEGDTLALGEVIARIGEGAAAESEPEEQGTKNKEQGAEPEPEEASEEPEPEKASSNGASSSEDGRVKASPVARRMARELGVELS